MMLAAEASVLLGLAGVDIGKDTVLVNSDNHATGNLQFYLISNQVDALYGAVNATTRNYFAARRQSVMKLTNFF